MIASGHALMVCEIDRLNRPQWDVLRWVADGCPVGRFDVYSHRVSAAALRTRDLIRIGGRGRTWHAELTDKGLVYLTSSAPAVAKRRRRAGSARRVPVAPAPSTPRPESSVPLAPVVAPPTDPIPADLRGAHGFVRATRSAASGLRAGADGRLRLGPRPGVIHMRISRQRLQRGLVLAHGLVSGALKRGWDVEAYAGSRSYEDRAGVAIAVHEHRYPIEIHEGTQALPFSQAEIEKWRDESSWRRRSRADRLPPPQLKRRESTGKIRLVLSNGYGGRRASWTDGSRLKDRLDSVFDALEQRLVDDDNDAAERGRREEAFVVRRIGEWS